MIIHIIFFLTDSDLNLMTPAQYEEEIKKISVDQREVLVIYSEPKKHYAQLSIF